MGNLTSNLQFSTTLAPHHSSTFLQDIVGIVEPEPSFQLFFSNQRCITKVSTLPSSPWWSGTVEGMACWISQPTAKNWTPIIMLALSEAAAQVLPYQPVEIQDSKGTGIQWWLSLQTFQRTNVSDTSRHFWKWCFSLPNFLQKLLQSHSSLAFGKRLLRMLTAGLTSTGKNTTAILKWCYTLQVAFPASSSESTKHRMQGTCTWWGYKHKLFPLLCDAPSPRRCVPWAPRYPSHVHWAARTKVPEKPPGCVTKLANRAWSCFFENGHHYSRILAKLVYVCTGYISIESIQANHSA